jgi:hypothetical protein
MEISQQIQGDADEGRLGVQGNLLQLQLNGVAFIKGNYIFKKAQHIEHYCE